MTDSGLLDIFSNDVSFFFKASEQEILFSVHTIFRIENIHPVELENDRLWEFQSTVSCRTITNRRSIA